MKIAVIGAGIAGLGAARRLAGHHDVTLYEAALRAGGHVYTVDAGGHAIDMGFIVCNRERYPRLFALFAELGIETRPTTMAFSVSLPGDDLEWGSASLAAAFADRRRLVDPRHWRFLIEVVRFVRTLRDDVRKRRLGTRTLDDYLERWPAEIRDRFAIPLAAALWSVAPEWCGSFPAVTFAQFLDHHGMLSIVRPLQWHTVVGGSRTYVEALIAELVFAGCQLSLGARVETLHRDRCGVTVIAGGREARFDRVVIATHADTALSLLAEPTTRERAVLGAFRYSVNRTLLHTDRRFLPRRPAAHASWNYIADPDTSRVCVTYSMTRLQGLPDRPYLVTLNPRREPRGVLAEARFSHPLFDLAAIAAQPELPRIGAELRTHYAGAHVGFGFHEDGLRSGIEAAEAAIVADVVAPAKRAIQSGA